MTIDDNSKTVNLVPAETGDSGPVLPRSPPLSDTALVMLAAAANRPDGSLLPVPVSVKARGSARNAVLYHLRKGGLVEDFPSSEEKSWRHHDNLGFLGLRITAAGLAVIGIETGCVANADGAIEPDGTSPSEPTAGAEQLRASDEAGTIADPALVPTEATRDAPPPSSRRPTKQDEILALLSREEGASIDVLMAATGWLPHTVRAVLSGLRKKGHAIDRRKDGDAGSVYRIVSSGSPDAALSATAADDAS